LAHAIQIESLNDDTERKVTVQYITLDMSTLRNLYSDSLRPSFGNCLLEPIHASRLAVPILIQVFFNSALAYWLSRAVGEKYNIASPSALIGVSNFFELAVAAAISLFGLESGAALATVVGVLIEVPVMLLVVKVANLSKGWYEAH